jgi:hypothetical protein
MTINTDFSVFCQHESCLVRALADQSWRLDLKRLENGIMREYIQEGKVV